MQTPQWLIDFWNNNLGNIIVSVITGVIFFVLGPIGVWFSGRRIRLERIRKAKDSLLDIVEGMMVSQEVVNEKKLSVLFRAVERDIEVTIGDNYDIENLLEDLTLRFEKSKHLDASQKEKYFTEIQKSLNEIKTNMEKKNEKVIPRSYAKILDDLKAALQSNNPTDANKAIEELEKRLKRSTNDDVTFSIFDFYKRSFEKNPRAATIATFIVLLFYLFIIFSTDFSSRLVEVFLR